MLAETLVGVPAFLTFLVAALLILALFLGIYLNVTPYREIALIREGNVAAATSLAGTLIGFILPVGHAIAQSHHLIDLAVWGSVACLVQLAAYLATRLLLPHLAEDIPAGKLAPALFLAALSLGVGILNAACMTY